MSMLSPFIENSSQGMNVLFNNEEFCDQNSLYDFGQMLDDYNQDIMSEYVFNDDSSEPGSITLILNKAQFDESLSNIIENTATDNHLLKINQLFLSTQEVDSISLKDSIVEKFTFAQTLLTSDDNSVNKIDNTDALDNSSALIFDKEDRLSTLVNQEHFLTHDVNNSKLNHLGILINSHEIKHVENNFIYDDLKEPFSTLDIDDSSDSINNQITPLLKLGFLNPDLLNRDLEIGTNDSSLGQDLVSSDSLNQQFMNRGPTDPRSMDVNSSSLNLLNFSTSNIKQLNVDQQNNASVNYSNDLSINTKSDVIDIQDSTQTQFQLLEQVDDMTMSSVGKAMYNAIKHDGKLEIVNIKIDVASNIALPNKIANAYSADKVTKTIRFLLNPQDLGEIEIKFDTDNILKFNNIRISVENNLTYEILNSIYHEIEQILKDNGFDDQNSSLSMNLQSQSHNSQFEEDMNNKQQFNITFATAVIPQVLEVNTDHEINIMA